MLTVEMDTHPYLVRLPLDWARQSFRQRHLIWQSRVPYQQASTKGISREGAEARPILVRKRSMVLLVLSAPANSALPFLPLCSMHLPLFINTFFRLVLRFVLWNFSFILGFV
jgi:hypothetical protein